MKIKAETEESIRRCIVQITDRLPDLKVYERIYPEPALAVMLAKTYGDVLIFAREATSYFLGSGLSIWETRPESLLELTLRRKILPSILRTERV